ncbi:MAG: type I restriction enzyme HsdR N-terminal domain-containing protein, partial [Candidatus Tectomicrobia bacterium]|nr:type I restriction enzyme HsdR N-terminal domain-containing protein [Candidatus Tectomicrobia bacterium]
MDSASLYTALQDFANAVTAKTTQITPGEPEDQLRAPFESFMTTAAESLGWNVVCTGETPLPDHLGRPDYAVHLNQLLAGYVELKAPGIGADFRRFKGHDRNQFKRFSLIPNMLYTDGNEWGLYRGGQLVDRVVRMSGDVSVDGGKAATLQDAQAVERVLRDFLLWEPFIPPDSQGRIDLQRFAEILAPLCRMLRNDVTDALKRPGSPLVRVAHDWRQLL